MSDVNLTAAAFPRFNAALARTMLGGAPARVAFVGDSEFEGGGVSARADSLPSQLQALIAGAAVFPVADGAIFGISGQYTDSRVVLGNGWSPESLPTWGPFNGESFSGLHTGSGDLQVTFPGSIDRIRVYYAISTFEGTFTVNVDGGSTLATINSHGANAVAAQTITCPLGSHTIHVPPPTGAGDATILAVEAWRSTVPTVLFANGATDGTLASGAWVATTSPWSNLAAFDLYQPDLTLISLGVNDAGGAESSAAFLAAMTTIVEKAQLYGDVLMTTCVPSQGARAPTEQGYITDAFVPLATSHGCGLHDVWLPGRMVSYANMSGLGYMADTVHPNAAGNGFWAGLLLPVFEAITAPQRYLGGFVWL